MVEMYPARGGVLIGSATEFTKIVSSGESVYLWFKDYAVKVPKEFFESEYWISYWLEDSPTFYWYSFTDLEEYVEYVAKSVKDKIEGKRIYVSFSGGKDSASSLVILDMLREYVNFKVRVGYVHMPYLEPLDNISEAERIASKLGFNIEILAPPESRVRSYLFREGLPYRGRRWCTYLKVRTLREDKKKFEADFEVKGDRLGECRKRFDRLKVQLRGNLFIEGKKFKPVFPLTILDILKIVREKGVVHKSYRAGCPRVSCSLCPYKSVFEFKVCGEVNDPGLIDSVLWHQYNRWYSYRVSFEDFKDYALWRYLPQQTPVIMNLRKRVNVEEEKITVKDIAELYSSAWTILLPKALQVDLETIRTRILGKKELKGIVTPDNI